MPVRAFENEEGRLASRPSYDRKVMMFVGEN